jgi:hypothetical protein
MSVQVHDYISVAGKAAELGCNVPTGLALLPRNFADAKTKKDLIHDSFTATVRVLLRQANILETRLEKQEERFPESVTEAFEWIGPIIFVGYSLYSQNPHVIDIALGVISNYLSDWFKGIPRNNRGVRLDIVVETKSKTCKRIHYDGNVEGLKQLPEIIREVNLDG